MDGRDDGARQEAMAKRTLMSTPVAYGVRIVKKTKGKVSGSLDLFIACLPASETR